MRCRSRLSKGETWMYGEPVLHYALPSEHGYLMCYRYSVGRDEIDCGGCRCSACLFLSLALLRSFRATEGTILHSAAAATTVKPTSFAFRSEDGLPSVARRQPSEGWWRWGESNPRPKRLWPNFYACIPPLISHPVRRRTGLSGRNRSVVRGQDARTERFKPSPAR